MRLAIITVALATFTTAAYAALPAFNPATMSKANQTIFAQMGLPTATMNKDGTPVFMVHGAADPRIATTMESLRAAFPLAGSVGKWASRMPPDAFAVTVKTAYTPAKELDSAPALRDVAAFTLAAAPHGDPEAIMEAENKRRAALWCSLATAPQVMPEPHRLELLGACKALADRIVARGWDRIPPERAIAALPLDEVMGSWSYGQTNAGLVAKLHQEIF